MREALGSGYTAALRDAYPDVPETSDFVMYWWEKAARLVVGSHVRRFGLITTNSIRMVFNRQVVQRHLKAISLSFAIPDHPWVDNSEGANVRIAMTIGTQGKAPGILLSLTNEEPLEDGSANVAFAETHGQIAADLSLGADTAGALPLKSNKGICYQGMNLVGEGFRLSTEQADALGYTEGATIIRRYQKGRELVQGGQCRLVIDAFGFTDEELRQRFPAVYQHLLIHVKPERDHNNRASRKKNWWLFGEPVGKLRAALVGLKRFIVTIETSKFKPFVFLETGVIPDHKLYAIASDDAFVLGILSSRTHQVWAAKTGGELEDRPTWTNTTCFLPFPFPASGEAAKEQIQELGEELDAHRKRVQAEHPTLTLTGIYNVLEALREGRPLTAKEKVIHDQGLVSVLRQLHDDLDAAVAQAYGWGDGRDLTDEEILTRLVALNAERATEEAQGVIRYLRPEYQNPSGVSASQSGFKLTKEKPAKSKAAKTSAAKTPWPKPLAERVRSVEEALRSANAPITAEALSKTFARASASDIQEILDTLVTLGRVHQREDSYSS